MAGVQYLRPPMADYVLPEHLQGPTADYVPQEIGGTLMLKALAMGAIAIFEIAFAKWRHYKTMCHRERQQENRLVIYQQSPGHTSADSNNSSLAFNYDQLDLQEQAQQQQLALQDQEQQQQQQQQSFPQLMSELRELRQQLKEQQQTFNAQLEQQKQQHAQYIQRLQLGMDERDQRKNDELQQLKTKLDDRQATIDQQRRRTEQAEAQNRQRKPEVDPYKEKSKRGEDDWQLGYKPPDERTKHDNPPAPDTPKYAIGTTTDIAKAIDYFIDDYELHGGSISERNVVASQIVPDWGARVRRRLIERGVKNGGGLPSNVGYNGKGAGYLTPIRRLLQSPESDSSPDRDTGYINNIRRNSPNGGDDDLEDNDNNGDPRDVEDNLGRRHQREYADDEHSKEFRLVNPRNITITTFIGKNLHNNPYFIFNNQLRRLILIMGKDGDELLEILDVMEKLGGRKFTRQLLAEYHKDYPKIYEYDRVVKAALLNWTAGLAQGLVTYGNEGGLDAWRKMYNKYVPLADDLQHILIRQLMSIKLVNEQDVDSLFDEIERIRELYIKVGSDDEPICEKWFKVAVLQNLIDKVVQALAIELKKAASVEEMQAIINTYMFDHRTGMMRGQSGPMLYLTEPEANNEDSQELNEVASYKDKLLTKPDEKTIKAPEDKKEKEGQELYNTSKGRGKGKGKTCWHCGEAGHFQRECPQAQNKETQNTLAALKGKGKGKGKKGTFGKYNYRNSYGKGKGNWNSWGKSPGKAIGTGAINYSGMDDDYWNAWGYDNDDWGNYGGEEDYGNYYGGLANVMMLLEEGKEIENLETEEEDKTTDTEIDTLPDMSRYTITGRDNLRGTSTATPITVHNKFDNLTTDDDSDSDDDDQRPTRRHGNRNHNPNRRQRRKARLARECGQLGEEENENVECIACGRDCGAEGEDCLSEAARDAAMSDNGTEADWQAEHNSITVTNITDCLHSCWRAARTQRQSTRTYTVLHDTTQPHAASHNNTLLHALPQPLGSSQFDTELLKCCHQSSTDTGSSSAAERVKTHECLLDGGEAAGLDSLSDGPPPTKLLSPETSVPTAKGTSSLNHPRGCPEHLVACPSTGTRRAGVLIGHARSSQESLRTCLGTNGAYSAHVPRPPLERGRSAREILVCRLLFVESLLQLHCQFITYQRPLRCRRRWLWLR